MSQDHIATTFVRNSPIPDDELMRNLGLYMNRHLLSRILFMKELYTKIVAVHGIVIEFGTRYGQNMSLFSSFRGLLEPFNMNRKLVCFDTFQGFIATDEKDGEFERAIEGEFSVNKGYEHHLQEVLEWHQTQSPLADIPRFEIRKGDAGEELKKYLAVKS